MPTVTQPVLSPLAPNPAAGFMKTHSSKSTGHRHPVASILLGPRPAMMALAHLSQIACYCFLDRIVSRFCCIDSSQGGPHCGLGLHSYAERPYARMVCVCTGEHSSRSFRRDPLHS